jgi:hypothetical protein
MLLNIKLPRTVNHYYRATLKMQSDIAYTDRKSPYSIATPGVQSRKS